MPLSFDTEELTKLEQPSGSGERTSESSTRQSHQGYDLQMIQIEQLYTTAPVGLGLIDQDMCYVQVNDFLAKIHGCSREDHIGKHTSTFIPEMFAQVEPYHRYVLATGESIVNIDFTGTSPGEQSASHWLVSYYPLKDKSGVTYGISVVVQDITERKNRELALVESQHKTSAQLEYTPLAALALDLDMRAVDWNLAAEKLFGFTRQEAVGRHLTELIVSKKILNEQVNTVFDNVLMGRGGERNINENIAKDGRRVICEWHNTPLYDREGKIVGIASIGQDITERRKLMEALIDSEKRYKMLIDTIPHAIQEVNLQADITLCNQALVEILGYEKSELMGKSLWSLLVTEREKEKFANYFLRLIDQKSNSYSFYTRFRCKNGNIIYVKINWNYVRDSKNNIVSLISGVIDVTKHKLAEEALLLSERRFETLASLSPVGFFHTDADGHLLYVNERWAEITGINFDESSPDDWFESIHLEDKARVAIEWSSLLVNKSRLKTELRFVGHEGETIWAIMQIRALTEEHDGKQTTVGFVGALVDITLRRANEEQIRQDQIKLAHLSRLHTAGEMVSGISHELNQPLTSIVHYTGGCIERMKAESVPEDIIAAMNKVMSMAERAGSIINRLKDFLRKGELKREWTDINTIIEESCKLVEYELLAASVETRLQLAAELPKIKVDKIQIEQVIINIISNAIEAMPNKPRILLITTECDGDNVITEITDNGVGFPDDVADKILTPFFTTKTKGMGMGLSISRSIVDNHGGKLLIENRQSGGSIVKIILPVHIDEDEDDSNG